MSYVHERGRGCCGKELEYGGGDMGRYRQQCLAGGGVRGGVGDRAEGGTPFSSRVKTFEKKIPGGKAGPVFTDKYHFRLTTGCPKGEWVWLFWVWGRVWAGGKSPQEELWEEIWRP